MNIFNYLYKKVISWSADLRARRYLFFLSFAESSFFPIPPDVMLIPMCLADKKKAWYYALITTLASVLGGVFGYFIGYFIFDLLELWLRDSNYWDSFQISKVWFKEWGLWAVLLAGISPIPYKIFTIAAGITGINLIGFILFSLLGRGARFFLIAAMISFFGERISLFLESYIERIGWSIVLLIVAFLIY
jgi:membrane protein YqaA with SNARE-associated domain